jgi:hypothetical protein
LEAYTSKAVLHQISTAAASGLPIGISNSTGLRYCIPLTPPKKMPKMLEFSDSERGICQMGVNLKGEAIAPMWADFVHLLVAGQTGSGKSNFLRLLAYQAASDGVGLLLADLDGTTFAPLAQHPSMMMPIAENPNDTAEVVACAAQECHRRAALYKQAPDYPENIKDYNKIISIRGGKPLPHLLVILDEFSTVITSLGGARGDFGETVSELSWRGRKFGIHVVVAAQSFGKDIFGMIRDQMSAICFHVESAQLARNVGCEGAEDINVPGRCISSRWGLMQTYYLEKDLLIALGQGDAEATIDTDSAPIIYDELTDDEAELMRDALANGGMVTRSYLESRGYSTNDAKRLHETWSDRGWIELDPMNNRGYRITRKAIDMLSSRPTRPTLSNPVQPS